MRRRGRPRSAGVVAGVMLVTALVGCATAPAPSATPAPSSTAGKLLVAVGNSFVGGSSMDSGTARRWPGLVATRLGMRLDVVSAGSSGYADAGDAGLTYRDLVREIPSDADVVIIMGSDDDAPYPRDEIEREARVALGEAVVRAPRAQIIVTSTPWVEEDPDAGIENTRDAVRAAASELGLEYIDGLGTWLVTGPPGQIGVDGLHPTDVGHARLADALAGPIRAAAEHAEG